RRARRENQDPAWPPAFDLFTIALHECRVVVASLREDESGDLEAVPRNRFEGQEAVVDGPEASSSHNDDRQRKLPRKRTHVGRGGDRYPPSTGAFNQRQRRTGFRAPPCCSNDNS